MKGSSPQSTFTFQTVDDTGADPGSNENAVTGINQSGQIVGTVGVGSPSSPTESYTSTPPYTTFQPVEYTNATGTAATSLSNSASNPILAGYIVKPPTLRGTWAFVNIKGIWTLFQDHKEGTGANSVTELLGLNDSMLAAGFYVNSSGLRIPVAIDVANEKFTQLKPPGAISAEATGINDTDHISGWEFSADGVAAFFVRAGVYYSLSYPGAVATRALSLNNQDQIVGYYRDARGTKHGFMLTNPTSASRQVWQTIDDPNAVYGTVVTGVNANDDISGYYVDGSGVQHGFVAAPRY